MRSKSQHYDRELFSPNGTLGMSSFLSSFKEPKYYFGNYQYGPVTQFSKVLAAIQSGQISSPTPMLSTISQNAFTINERIWAGYVMNTITFGNLRLQAGVRIESTDNAVHANTLLLSSGNLSQVLPGVQKNSYINAFPSVQAQYRFGSNTILRAAYGMGIARPNFGDIAPYFVDDPTSNPEFSKGNPHLKPTHAQNFDLLAEHYLKQVGMIQAGFFYKYLTNPIYSVTLPFQTATQSTLTNGPSAHIAGFEAAWQQRLTFLPGLLNGIGVRANYSYTSSQATFPTPSASAPTIRLCYAQLQIIGTLTPHTTREDSLRVWA